MTSSHSCLHMIYAHTSTVGCDSDDHQHDPTHTMRCVSKIDNGLSVARTLTHTQNECIRWFVLLSSTRNCIPQMCVVSDLSSILLLFFFFFFLELISWLSAAQTAATIDGFVAFVYCPLRLSVRYDKIDQLCDVCRFGYQIFEFMSSCACLSVCCVYACPFVLVANDTECLHSSEIIEWFVVDLKFVR